MWMVYNWQDTPQCGWSAENENDAIRQCTDDENLRYCYMNLSLL